jgi:hypothetical protein
LIHWLLIFTESDWEVGLVSFVDEQPVSSTGMDRAAAATPARRTEVSEGISSISKVGGSPPHSAFHTESTNRPHQAGGDAIAAREPRLPACSRTDAMVGAAAGYGRARADSPQARELHVPDMELAGRRNYFPREPQVIHHRTIRPSVPLTCRPGPSAYLRGGESDPTVERFVEVLRMSADASRVRVLCSLRRL